MNTALCNIDGCRARPDRDLWHRAIRTSAVVIWDNRKMQPLEI